MGSINTPQSFNGGSIKTIISSIFTLGLYVIIYIKGKDTPTEGIITEIGTDFLKIGDSNEKIPFSDIDLDKSKKPLNEGVLRVISSSIDKVALLTSNI